MTVVSLPAYLAAEIARVDELISRVVLAMRMRRALTQEEFRGLLVSDAQIDAALTGQGRPPPGQAKDPRPPLPPLGPETPWQALVRRLSLSDIEQDVLLLALLPHLDRRYEAVFAYLNDRMSATWPTVDLAARVFEGLPGLTETLAPEGRLARLGALTFRSQAEARGWRAQEIEGAQLVVLWLLGGSWQGASDGLGAPIGYHPPTEPPRPTAGALFHATGPQAEARQQVLARRFARLGWQAVDLDAPSSPKREGVREWALAARLWDLAPVLEGRGQEAAIAFLKHWPKDLPLGLNGGCMPPVPGRPVVGLEASPQAPGEATTHWQRAAGCDAETARRLALSYDLGPNAITAVAAAAALEGAGEDALFAAARQARLVDFGPLARQVETERSAAELVLPQATEAAIDDLSGAIAHRRQVLVDWGFWAERGGGALSALFTGPSGTGKTLAATALARRAGLNLYRIDLSSVVDKYIGETEKNLERVFEAAEGSDAMLLFDEADALFGKRSETREAKDRYANLEVSYLLQRIECLPPGVVVILTTNLAKNMDQAFSRRLTHVIDFPPPTAPLRKRLWAAIFPSGAPVDPDLDLSVVAETFELTGGEIRQVALDAAFRAAARGTTIGLAEVAAALRRHHEKLGRAFPERALGSAMRALPAAE